jgi:hypothetical protein
MKDKQGEPVGIVIEIEEVYGHTFKKRKSKRVQWSQEVDAVWDVNINETKVKGEK